MRPDGAHVHRRAFIGTLAGSLLAAPLAAESQQAGRTVRVGILSASPLTMNPEQAMQVRLKNPLWATLKDLGWMYGQNLVVEDRWGESADQLRAAAVDLVRLKVDVLWSPGFSPAAHLLRETKTIPIVVFQAGIDLVAEGFVASLARPGGNLTGSQVLQGVLVPKRLELLKALVPGLSRVALLQDGVTTTAVPNYLTSYAQQAEVAARPLGLKTDTFIVHHRDALASAFLEMMKARDQGLLVMSTNFFSRRRKEIVDLAVKHRIVTLYEHPQYAEAGGLISYGASSDDMLRGNAVYIDKILRGAKPGDLPIEQPTKFELILNVKTAKALGLTIPPSLLQRADQVIEL
jgi:putative tryptophan/tyrosine transport system substrate-binding protein